MCRSSSLVGQASIVSKTSCRYFLFYICINFWNISFYFDETNRSRKRLGEYYNVFHMHFKDEACRMYIRRSIIDICRQWFSVVTCNNDRKQCICKRNIIMRLSIMIRTNHMPCSSYCNTHCVSMNPYFLQLRLLWNEKWNGYSIL